MRLCSYYPGFSRKTEMIGYMCVCGCVCVYMYTCMCAYMHIYVCVYIHVYICKRGDLAHVIMKAKKAHHLSRASWRTRKTGVTQSVPDSLRARGVNDVTLSLKVKAWERGGGGDSASVRPRVQRLKSQEL